MFHETNLKIFTKNFFNFLPLKSKVFKNTNIILKKKKNFFFGFKKPLYFKGYLLNKFKDFQGKFKYYLNIGLKGELEIYEKKTLKKNFEFLYKNLNILNLKKIKFKFINQIFKSKRIFFSNFKVYKIDFLDVNLEISNLITFKNKFKSNFFFFFLINLNFLSKNYLIRICCWNLLNN